MTVNVFRDGKRKSKGYNADHARLYRRRGAARDLRCEDCDKPADEWSHRHGTDPGDAESYDPRCYSCHRQYDMTDEKRKNIAIAATHAACQCGREFDLARRSGDRGCSRCEHDRYIRKANRKANDLPAESPVCNDCDRRFVSVRALTVHRTKAHRG